MKRKIVYYKVKDHTFLHKNHYIGDHSKLPIKFGKLSFKIIFLANIVDVPKKNTVAIRPKKNSALFLDNHGR